MNANLVAGYGSLLPRPCVKQDPTGHGRSTAAAGVPDSFSGEVGSTVGQQPFRDGLRVREVQPAH
jgi:hypothetical protein